MNVCNIQEPGECSQYSDYATGWMIYGFIPDRGKRFFPSVNHPGWLWGSLSRVFHGYCTHCLWRQSSQGHEAKTLTSVLQQGQNWLELSPAPHCMPSQCVWEILSPFFCCVCFHSGEMFIWKICYSQTLFIRSPHANC